MKEIVYQEAAKGVFVPAPTRAQKREAKRMKAARAKKIQNAMDTVLVGLIVAGCAAVFAADIWATKFYVGH